MKKIRLLPLLLAAPLLVSCGSKVKVKELKFADKGGELEYSEFFTKLMEASEASAMSKEDPLPSASFSDVILKSDTSKTVRGKEELKSSYTGSESKMERKFDASSHVAYSKGSYKASSESKDAEKTATSKQQSKAEAYVQEGKKGEKSYLVDADAIRKQYSAIGELSEELPVAKAFDAYTKTLVSASSSGEISRVLASYAHEDEEGKKDFKFYNADKVFTVEYKHEVKEEKVYDMTEAEAEAAGKQRTLLYEENSVSSFTVQLDLTDGKSSYKKYGKSTSERAYKAEYIKLSFGGAPEYFKAGDVVSSEQLESEEVSYTYDSKVSLKAIDLGKYSPAGEF